MQQIFSVALHSDGTTHVDGALVAADRELLLGARAALKRNAEVRAVVQADGTVPHAA